ncbi:hypothetical protein H8S90_18180 [Olivibacter sp. SDN3]|uniref:hypothetical protein n=1 Tax=Olivibacter sp. SDN3 TaxID=2764720 RepID=UPI00165150DC|nr:hypothetical protein [Olivibacter sp. SDN3]QNL48695.1 hypothetical protein H8S90_18180 [Olivibacter sp. SDN3]
MFKQITSLNGNEAYLIASLWIFFIFFIIVGIILIRMKKQHTTYMSNLPFGDEESEQHTNTD